MLSTPPAFILSQDQTLRSKAASPPPTDHVSVILFENSPSGPRAPDREKVKACSLECPSDIREDVCSVSRIPSSVSGCQGSAGGFPPRRPRERRKKILYRVSCWLSTTFFKIFENSFPTGTRRHGPRGDSRRAFLKRGFSRIPLRLQERKGEFRKFFKRHLRHTCNSLLTSIYFPPIWTAAGILDRNGTRKWRG